MSARILIGASHAAAARSSDARATMKRATKPARVDDADVARVVLRYLERQGYEGARKAFLKDAATTLGDDAPRGGGRKTKDLKRVIDEYVRLKDAEHRRRHCTGVVGKMMKVIDDALAGRESKSRDEGRGRGRRGTRDDASAASGSESDAVDDDERSESESEEIVEREIAATRRAADAAPAPAGSNRRKKASVAPKRFVPGRGPTANGNAVASTSGARSMHGTPKLTPLSAKAPLGSLRPFHMPELADGAAQKKMADVIVGALGGRGKVQLSKYGDPAKGELIDEGTVENVMQSLMDADDELGEFLFSMIDEVERDVALRAVDAQGPPEHAFGSPRKKSKN